MHINVCHVWKKEGSNLKTAFKFEKIKLGNNKSHFFNCGSVIFRKRRFRGGNVYSKKMRS